MLYKGNKRASTLTQPSPSQWGSHDVIQQHKCVQGAGLGLFPNVDPRKNPTPNISLSKVAKVNAKVRTLLSESCPEALVFISMSSPDINIKNRVGVALWGLPSRNSPKTCYFDAWLSPSFLLNHREKTCFK